MVFTWCTTLECFFLALLELPPPTNPPTIVLMICLSPFLSSLLRGLLSLVDARVGGRFLVPSGGSSPFVLLAPSWGSLGTLAPEYEPTEVPILDKFFNLIFNAWHSSVVYPLFLWYRHLRVQSALLGLAAFLGGGISSALRASSKIIPLSALKGVYLMNQWPWLSLLLSLRLVVGRLWHSFLSFTLSPLASDWAWFLKSLSPPAA